MGAASSRDVRRLVLLCEEDLLWLGAFGLRVGSPFLLFEEYPLILSNFFLKDLTKKMNEEPQRRPETAAAKCPAAPGGGGAGTERKSAECRRVGDEFIFFVKCR